MTKKNVEKAITIVETSRQTHVGWIEYLNKYGKNPFVKAEAEIAGGLRHHKKCVKGYDYVIKVLQDTLNTK